MGVQELGQRYGASLVRHPWRWFAGAVAVLFSGVRGGRVMPERASALGAILMVMFTAYSVVVALVIVPRVIVPQMVRKNRATIEVIATMRWGYAVCPAVAGLACRIIFGVTWAAWAGWVVSTALLAYTAATIDRLPRPS